VSPGKRLDDPDSRLLRWGWLALAAWMPIGGAPQRLNAGSSRPA